MHEAFLVARVLPFRPAPSPYPALDYLVPFSFSSEIQKGKRVRIHVKQRRMEGLVLDLFPLEESKFQNLKLLDEIFPSPALDEKQINDLESIARFFGGRLSNILDLALAARVKYVESQSMRDREWSVENEEALCNLLKEASGLYSGLSSLTSSLSNFEDQSFVWDLAQKRGNVFECLALLGLLSKKLGYSFLACLPSDRFFDQAKKAFSAYGLDPVFVGSNLGNAKNYSSFLSCCKGGALALGTRRAMYLPMKDPCLMVDLDALGQAFTDGMAPYANVRDVLSIRHKNRGGIRISMSYCHAAEQEKWLREKTALHIFPSAPAPVRPVCFSRDKLLEMGDRFVHLPSLLVEELRKNGKEGKKSLLVCPAGSDITFFLCPKCSAFMRCDCKGSLKSRGKEVFCSRCRKRQEEWVCSKCGATISSHSLVALKRGPEHVKEELKGLLKEKDLKNVEVSLASSIEQKPYSLVAILDAWLSFFSLNLDAESKVLNSWMEASSLASEKVILIGEGQKELLASFEGWNYVFPAWDLEEKRKAGMPPFRTALNIWGPEKEVQKSVEEVLEGLEAPKGEFEIMGPMPIPKSGEYLCVLFVSPPFADALGEAVASVSHLRTAPDAHFWIDPYCFGRR